MNDDDDDKLKSGLRSTGLGPGERLQAARIQKSLSIDDVADRMHLSTAILEAIEDNRFEEITAPIFVKGYLRAYARIVSLGEDEIIQQYVDSYSREDPPITTTSNMAPELSVADVRIKWTTYLVIIILAALLAAWWWNKKQAETSPLTLENRQESQQQAAAGSDAAGAVVEAPASGTALNESLPETGQAAETAETAGGQAEPATIASAGTESTAQEPAEVEAAVEPADLSSSEPAMTSESTTGDSTTQIALAEAGQGEEVVENPVAAEAQASEAEAAPRPISTPRLTAPSGSDRLEIVVNADTWADIKDGTEFQMVYDLLRADQRIELTGSAPFSVFLGNGHGVEIRFNGEEIEFSGRIRDDNTTRLRIGG